MEEPTHSPNGKRIGLSTVPKHRGKTQQQPKSWVKPIVSRKNYTIRQWRENQTLGMDRRETQPQTTPYSIHVHKRQGDIYIPPQLVWNTQAHSPEREWILHPKILSDSHDFTHSLREENQRRNPVYKKGRENNSLCEGDQSMKNPPNGACEEAEPSLQEK